MLPILVAITASASLRLALLQVRTLKVQMPNQSRIETTLLVRELPYPYGRTIASGRCRGPAVEVIKKLLHLPASFPDITIHLPHRAAGLGAVELARVAPECQLKAFARLERLNSSTVDAMEGPLMECRGALSASLGVPHVSLVRRSSWRQTTGFGRKIGDSGRPGHMGDGDRNKSFRLRTNLFPTSTLSNKHAADPRAGLCRRCGQKEEMAFHIL
ncbi:hypothetical protein HPB48_000481 [Haemaphysalis longicornis]|uniref:Secreted protein n=1 Tax=Haemaphysalis longicornis TaxID=44386 RepID=A0A9J6H0I5_HAELO|nr:hypothetical protein HPB48_000481 [Haemaphysalis longicornis]